MKDAELVGRILAGEERLFGDLVERYSNFVWALCAGYTANPADCEELVQRSFVKCYERLDSLREPRTLPRWLGQIARTQCLGWIRAKTRRETAMTRYAEERQDDAAPSPAVSLEREELHRAIRAELARLPAKYGEALSLYYTGGYSTAEAAKLLGITKGTMRKRLQVGREKLRQTFTGEIESALASAKPPGRLKAGILAAIPFGSAPWSAGGPGSRTPALAKPIRGGTIMSKTALLIPA